MKTFTRYALVASSLLLWSIVGARSACAASHSVGSEAIINIPIADAWLLFTSADGLRSLGYTQAKVSAQLGGPLQFDGGSAALPTVSGEIISLDPQHMLSFKPIGSADNEQWSIMYFVAMGTHMTQVRWLEFFPENQTTMVSARQQQVRTLFDQLIRRFAPECEVCKQEK